MQHLSTFSGDTNSCRQYTCNCGIHVLPRGRFGEENDGGERSAAAASVKMRRQLFQGMPCNKAATL